MCAQKSVLILDARNCVIKAKIARCERGVIVFPHALKTSTETSMKTFSDVPKPLEPSRTMCGSMVSHMSMELA